MRPSAFGTGLLIVALVSTPGCGVESFQCSQHANCEIDGVGGSCEANGYCSFPDPACDSGRRYGEHAGDMLGKLCVPVDDATEGTGIPPGSASAVPMPGVTSGASGVGSTDGGSSDGSIPGFDSGVVDTTDTTGGDTNEGAGCDSDEFDALGSRWNNWNSELPVVARDGLAVYDLGGQLAFNGLHSVEYDDFRESTLRAEVVQIFDPGSYSQFEVGVTNEDGSWVYAFVGQGRIGLVERTPDSHVVLVDAPAPPFGDRLYLTLELHDGQMRAIGTADEEAPIVLPWYRAPMWIADSTIMLDGSAFEAGGEGVVRVDRFEVCETSL